MQQILCCDQITLQIDIRIQELIHHYKGQEVIRDLYFDANTIQQLIGFVKLYDYKLPQVGWEDDVVANQYINNTFKQSLLQESQQLYQLSLDYEVEYLSNVLREAYNKLPTVKGSKLEQSNPYYEQRKKSISLEKYQEERKKLIDKYINFIE